MEPKIPLTRDVSLDVNWHGFHSQLATVAGQGLLTALGGDGGSNAISAVISAASSISLTSPPGEKVWSIFCLGFAYAFDNLRAKKLMDGPGMAQAIRDAIASARQRVDQEEQFFDKFFLKSPSSLRIYQIARDDFLQYHRVFRLSDKETISELRAKFDTAFNSGILNIYIGNPSIFESISALLSSDPYQIAAKELQWGAYREMLLSQFYRDPVFAQEGTGVSLSQLYIPLRAVHYLPKKRSRRTVEFTNFQNRDNGKLINLEDDITKWIRKDNNKGNVYLVGGGPGSGKSTTLKSIAAKLSKKDSISLLYTPLQFINIGEDLFDEINKYFIQHRDTPFNSPVLDPDTVENQSQWVIIFDGLDELARPGDGASQIAILFSTKLNHLIPRMTNKNENSNIKFIVSGRLPAFDLANRFLKGLIDKSVEVLGYHPVVDKFEFNDESEDLINLAKADQRVCWWKKFSSCFQKNEELPRIFEENSLKSLTDEPLICYLLAISGYLESELPSDINNINTVYEKLVNDVWSRGWGDSSSNLKRQGPGKHLGNEDFNDLMETIAFSAWLGGDTRVATEERFKSCVELMNAEEAWKSFSDESGEDISNLAINFYFQS